MLLRALIIAFGMYSKIPVPKVDWDEKSMKYALCFFPLIGVVTGAAAYTVGMLLYTLNVGALLRACIMTVLPVLITGGIHLDGFLDTMDGISSYANREKRLEILKDSNSGAFAIIGGLVYFTLSIGFFSELKADVLPIAAAGYVLSRSLSGLSVVAFKAAKKTGLVSTFSSSADETVVKAVMMLYFAVTAAFMIYINIACGAIAVISALLCFTYHYYNCIKNFGGITGDLAGYFLQLCELTVLMSAVIGRCFV